ncbi:MAG: molybdopterin-dependent oxidoreductase [Azonexus sp.]
MQTEMRETASICCYCGTGCGLVIQSVAGEIVGVRGDETHPANFGRLCTKGSTLHLTTTRSGRALHPELRRERGDERLPVAWPAALEHAAERFAAIIREHGPDAVAFYISGQLLTEDYYVFNKLAKGLIGTNNIDSNSRLCMSSAVSGYKGTLGADSVPCSYEDLGLADLLLIAGSNTAWAHPIVFRRIEEARAANPELRLIVVDPRRTDTAAAADLHLQIQPGSDVVLYGAMLHVLLWEGLINHAFIAEHTDGFAALREEVRELTPSAAAAVCGVKAEDIVTAARWFGQAKAPLSLWCQGINQSAHGTANNSALIHLHLATGKIGAPGMGPFSLTGQPNAMGGREVGAMANLLPGHRDLANADDRAAVAAQWGIAELPAQAGATAVELFEAIGEGRIKAVWIACTNPAHSLPDQARVRAALDKAEFVVVQEAYADTETCAYADLLLPATTWGEKEGTVTNSERRVSRVRAAIAAPGEARADWVIARDFALMLGEKLEAGETARRLFAFADEAAVFAEHVSLTAGRDLDMSGLDYPLLDSAGPRQWPFSTASRQAGEGGTARLYTDHRFATADGRARFVPLTKFLTAEKTDARYPLHLNTGRLRDQWHGMSRTGRVARLYAHEAEARLLLHPQDMARRGLVDGDLAEVASRRAKIVLPVAASDEMAPGQAFLPMHWGGRSLSHAGANCLTMPAFDAQSKQPELKHAAIRLDKAELPWRLVALRTMLDQTAAAEQVLIWRQRLAALLPDWAFASLTLAGREQPVVVLRIALAEALPAAKIDELAKLLDFDEQFCLAYRDARRGICKIAQVEPETAGDLTCGVLLAGETAAADWLLAAMSERQPAESLRRWLLAPVSTPPTPVAGKGRIVCNCFNVGESEIAAALAAGADLDSLQQQLKCGTSCGSCLPEIRKKFALKH